MTTDAEPEGHPVFETRGRCTRYIFICEAFYGVPPALLAESDTNEVGFASGFPGVWFIADAQCRPLGAWMEILQSDVDREAKHSTWFLSQIRRPVDPTSGENTFQIVHAVEFNGWMTEVFGAGMEFVYRSPSRSDKGESEEPESDPG